MVAGDGGEEGIQQVVAFVVNLGIVNAEYLVDVGGGPLDHREVAVIDDDGQ